MMGGEAILLGQSPTPVQSTYNKQVIQDRANSKANARKTYKLEAVYFLVDLSCGPAGQLYHKHHVFRNPHRNRYVQRQAQRRQHGRAATIPQNKRLHSCHQLGLLYSTSMLAKTKQKKQRDTEFRETSSHHPLLPLLCCAPVLCWPLRQKSSPRSPSARFHRSTC